MALKFFTILNLYILGLQGVQYVTMENPVESIISKNGSRSNGCPRVITIIYLFVDQEMFYFAFLTSAVFFFSPFITF
ncbi:hypothetical protein Ct9H90mP29_21680 [bacterium]|nr:MAG: hypothetical protein Ct9H90mP29_21680 [bacterium]